MKGLIRWSAVLFACVPFHTEARDILPSWDFETHPSTDGASAQCLTFTARAGFRHRVEVSDNLVTWQTTADVYGVGQKIVHSMREIMPPPPPAPGSPPAEPEPPAHLVSLLMTPCTDAGGGTIVSWLSLTDGQPVRLHINGELDAAWQQMPFYLQRFGTFEFCVFRQDSLTATAPSNPSIPGGLDADLLETLEEHLDEMNTAVAASATAARNAPPPAPSAPDSRKFFRIRVNELDSDGDGITDDVEFTMAPPGGSGPSGDPFNADTNGNGIPDGAEVDTDGDGIPDASDVSPNNGDDATEILPIPRYAFFELAGKPLHINDRGTVIMADKTVWAAGDMALLDGGGTPIAINDQDKILGTVIRPLVNPPSGGGSTALAMCAWDAPDEPLRHIQDATGTTWAIPSIVTSYAMPGVLDNSGTFPGIIGYPAGGRDGLTVNAWTIGQMQSSSGIQNVPYGLDSGLRWGITDDVYSNGTKLTGLGFTPRRVVRDKNDPARLTAYVFGEAKVSVGGGGWSSLPDHRMVICGAGDGTSIGMSHQDASVQPSVAKILPIRINGKWQSIERTAPDVPERWTDGTSHLHDITHGGWILASRGFQTYGPGGIPDPTYPDMHAGALLPLRIEGVPPGDPKEATGVDDFSIGSTDPDAGPNAGNRPVHDRVWIMAPYAGESATQVKINAPIHSSTPLKLSATGIQFGNGGNFELTGTSTTFPVISTSAGNSGTDITATLSIGGTNSVSLPIGIKPMKHRTVKMTLWLIARDLNPPGVGPEDPGYIEPERPAFGGTASDTDIETEVETYLNRIYKPQVNISFNVTVRRAAIRWDSGDGTIANLPAEVITAPNHHLDIDGNFGGEMDLIRSVCNDETANINVYIPGKCNNIARTFYFDGKKTLTTYGGMSNPEGRFCAVTDEVLIMNPKPELLYTMAHEIGHIMIGAGHPNESSGPAPLPDADNKRRLMVSGNEAKKDFSNVRLVKAEWDKIEEWLVNEQNERGLQ